MTDKCSANFKAGALVVVGLLALVAVAGCQRGPILVPVSGEVSWQGEKVAAGQIVFADADGTIASAAAPIVSGRYNASVPPGNKIVRITASQATGKMIDGGMGVQIPEQIDLIPAEFNVQSKLTREVP